MRLLPRPPTCAAPAWVRQASQQSTSPATCTTSQSACNWQWLLAKFLIAAALSPNTANRQCTLHPQVAQRALQLGLDLFSLHETLKIRVQCLQGILKPSSVSRSNTATIAKISTKSSVVASVI